MAIYTVHEPPRRAVDTLSHTARFAFVRDGFSFPAFVLGPLWMLRHWMWVVLIGYLVVVAGLVLALRAVGAGGGSVVLVGFLVSLLVGIEASTLRRWTLARRGWTSLGVVVGDDLEAAERRFFDAWTKGRDAPRSPPAAAAPAHMPSGPAQDVLGLFPEPGARS